MTNAKILKNADGTPFDLGPPQLEVFLKDPRAKLPRRANDGAIGFDVYAFLLSETGQPLTKAIGRTATVAIPTGLVLRPPKGYYVQCCSRSGLASHSLFVANSPGIIDPDYSGELFILLFNGGFETQYVKHEHRIAQLILTAEISVEILQIPNPPTPVGRGDAGFGSTGI